MQPLAECGSVGRVWKGWQSLECGEYENNGVVLAELGVWGSVWRSLGKCGSDGIS